jgi:hypothetical protein
MDQLFAHSTLDAAMFTLYLISKRHNSPWEWDSGKDTEIRFGPEDAKAVVIALHSVIQAKRALKRSVKADKALYTQAKAMFLATNPAIEDIIEVNKAINYKG